MASGNLSWLNLLTMVLAVPAVDDRVLRAVLPFPAPALHAPALPHKIAVALVAVLVAVLSARPIANMLSPRQVMNTSYNPFHLVGTYGAFGGITRMRYEVVVEGTMEDPGTTAAEWREYEFRGKPTSLTRRPPQIAPYHLRLDWLMWFAAMSDYSTHPWFVHFMGKLLEGDAATLSLLRSNPFPAGPPKYIRAQLYLYEFTSPEERKRSGEWWKREYTGEYFPAISLRNEGLQRVFQEEGWK